MRSMIEQHYALLDRSTAFLLGLGVGGLMLSDAVVAAWALLLVSALARMALLSYRTEQPA